MNTPKTARELVRLLRQRAEKAEARVGELEAERAALLRLLKTECFCEAGGVLGRTAGKPFVCGVCRRIDAALRGGEEE